MVARARRSRVARRRCVSHAPPIAIAAAHPDRAICLPLQRYPRLDPESLLPGSSERTLQGSQRRENLNARHIALISSIAATLALTIAPAAFGRSSDGLDIALSGRAKTNFNAGWRFKLGKSEGAEAPKLDDHNWEAVGLPHSFSEPYFRAAAFYTGDGWYRKTFSLPTLTSGRRLSLEFEGAFQDARVYVNGIEVAHHRGGYTGFPVDITGAIHPGRNVVAVRVNNDWDPTLAPRAGEHVFSGGLYRDVWLVASDDVHVPWTGTRITTPELSAASGKVAVEIEVRND